MKKLTALLLCTVLAFSLCACGDSEPTAPPSSTPSADPSTEPSTEPSAGSQTLTITAPDGEDITERVRELWTYANDLYHPGDPDTEGIRYDLLIGYGYGYRYNYGTGYAPLEGFHTGVEQNFTADGLKQLLKAKDVEYSAPMFIEWGETMYRMIDDFPENRLGDIADATVLADDGDLRLLIKYVAPMYVNIDRPLSERPDNHFDYALLTLEEGRDGVWRIDDYEHAEKFYLDYFSPRESYEYHTILDSDGNDIFERLLELWKAANGTYESYNHHIFTDTGSDWELMYGDELLRDFESVTSGYFTENAVQQILSATRSGKPIIENRDGEYYRTYYWGEMRYMQGILDAWILERTEDELDLAILYAHPDETVVADWYSIDAEKVDGEWVVTSDDGTDSPQWVHFRIVKVDGEWLVDSYKYPHYEY